MLYLTQQSEGQCLPLPPRGGGGAGPPPTPRTCMALHNSTADLQNPSRMAGVGASLRCVALGHLGPLATVRHSRQRFHRTVVRLQPHTTTANTLRIPCQGTAIRVSSLQEGCSIPAETLAVCTTCRVAVGNRNVVRMNDQVGQQIQAGQVPCNKGQPMLHRRSGRDSSLTVFGAGVVRYPCPLVDAGGQPP